MTVWDYLYLVDWASRVTFHLVAGTAVLAWLLKGVRVTRW